MKNVKIAIAYGRMNPVTRGHQLVVDKLLEQDCDTRLYLSHTEFNQSNPLPYSEKMRYAIEVFGHIVHPSHAINITKAMQECRRDGYIDITIVCGYDRYFEYDQMLTRVDYDFRRVELVSCGRRDDYTDLGNVSASRMRGAAKRGNFKKFCEMAHKDLSKQSLDEIFWYIRR